MTTGIRERHHLQVCLSWRCDDSAGLGGALSLFDQRHQMFVMDAPLTSRSFLMRRQFVDALAIDEDHIISFGEE